MPIIPTYRRQERYRAPQVDASAPAPRRMKQAYENAWQEGSEAGQAALTFLQNTPSPHLQKSSSRSAASPQASSAQGQQNPSNPAQEQDGLLRAQLLQTVRQKMAENGSVRPEELDEFAAAHFPADGTETPAVRDYVMLRAAAQADRQTAQRQEKWEQAQTEEKWVSGIGALAPSAAALEEYLSAQMPSVQSRLQAAGVEGEALRKQTARLQAQTAAQCVRQALLNRQPAAAAEVFSKYEAQWSERQRNACAEKIRFSAGAERAQRLWNASLTETDGTPQARGRWAEEQLSEEKNTELKTTAGQALASLRAEAEAELNTRQAQLYRALAAAPNAQEAQNLLDGQDVLDASQTAQARRAVQERRACSDAEKFNQLYFSESEKELSRAFEKGQLSARDYCLLQAVRHERAAGQDERETRLLCQSMDYWQQKKGLSPQQAQAVQYAVLSVSGGAEERREAWKQAKALFNL